MSERPSAVYFTPGEEFLDRWRIEIWRWHTFDRLGVGTSKTPTKTNNWLTETAPNSPIFNNMTANIPRRCRP